MPDDQIADLHRRLDTALTVITRIRENGTAAPAVIPSLVHQENALRYQVG